VAGSRAVVKRHMKAVFLVAVNPVPVRLRTKEESPVGGYPPDASSLLWALWHVAG
jgi:hypothetical protein